MEIMHEAFVKFPCSSREEQWLIVDSKEMLKFIRNGTSRLNKQVKLFSRDVYKHMPADEIACLSIETETTSATKIVKLLRHFKNLRFLGLPTVCIKELTQDTIPSSVAILHVVGSGTANFGKTLKFPNIERLSVGRAKFSKTQFPCLRHLDANLDDKSLGELAEYRNLITLNLQRCNNERVFRVLQELNLEFLGITGGKLASLSGIEKLTTMQGLWLQNLSKLTDLTPLSACVALEELTIGYCMNLVRVRPLTRINRLRKLNAYGCGDIGLRNIEAQLGRSLEEFLHSGTE